MCFFTEGSTFVESHARFSANWKGRCGLRNLGNTCYMYVSPRVYMYCISFSCRILFLPRILIDRNALLQSLSNIDLFRHFFMDLHDTLNNEVVEDATHNDLSVTESITSGSFSSKRACSFPSSLASYVDLSMSGLPPPPPLRRTNTELILKDAESKKKFTFKEVVC